MGVVWYRFRAEARRTWKAWLAVGILVGLGSGAVLALIAGARRTDSAIDRLLARSIPTDVVVISGVPGLFDFAELDLREVAALPGVADAVHIRILTASGTSSGGAVMSSANVNFLVDPTGRNGNDIDRYKMLAGRRADLRDPGEVIVSYRVAEAFDLDVGDSISVNFFDPSEFQAVFAPNAGEAPTLEQFATRGPLEELRIVGIYVYGPDLGSEDDGTFGVDLTPAAYELHRDVPAVEALTVKLAGGEPAVSGFLESVEVLGGDVPVLAFSLHQTIAAAKVTVRPYTRALVIAALLFVLVVALVGGQTLARQAWAESGEHPALVAVGFSRIWLLGLACLKGAAVGAVAATVAGVFAVVASPVFPLGPAGTAEPRPGVRVDALVLALGVPLTLLAVAGLGAVAGLWATRRVLSPARLAPARSRSDGLAGALGRAGARPSVVAGVQAALRGGQGRAVPATVSAIALGLLATTGALAFSASLQHLTQSPPLYGWNWHVEMGQPFSAAFEPAAVAEASRDPAVVALAVGDQLEVDLGGRRLQVLGVEQVAGAVDPSVIRGRAPTSPGEVVVGPGVAEVGDRVTAGFAGATTELRVVGVAALPGIDAMTTLETLRRLAPGTLAKVALVRLADPGDLDGFLERVTPALGLLDDDVTVPTLSRDVADFGQIDRLPALMAAMLSLVAVGTLLHALSLSVRRRRRELAVMKALGFTRGQVLSSVAAQATTLAGLSLALGVPLGVVAGRALWLRFADGLGVVPVAVVPVLATAGVVLASLLVANLAAVGPGWRAARTPAALALRTE